MANRYWVGGSGTWDASSTTNWSATSGGAGGASVPTSADAVIFDSNSGAPLTLTMSGTLNCLSLSRASAIAITANTSASCVLNCYGAVSFYCSGGYSAGSGSTLNLYSTASDAVVLTAIFENVNVKASAQYFLLSFSTTSSTTPGTVKVLTIGETGGSASSVGLYQGNIEKIFVKGSGTSLNNTSDYVNSSAYITGTTQALTVESGATVTTSSGYNIKLRPGSAGTVEISNSGTAAIQLSPNVSGVTYQFTGNGSYAIVRDSSISQAFTMKFDINSNPSISTWSMDATNSYKVTIGSTVPGTRATITKTGGGTASSQYVIVSDMQPAPDDTWISYNSTNAGNNYRWYFNNFTKPTSNIFFGSHV